MALPMGSVAVVVGTRPEAIKLSEIVRQLGPAACLIHTGQHYSPELWSSVASDIGLPEPTVAMSVGGRSRSAQIGDAVIRLGQLFSESTAIRAVLVHGDTNATLAGALAANAHGVPLLHVEAGLRSRDRRMPEEHNRLLVDHLADMCFAPTTTARENLLSEAIADSRVAITGNTIVETVRQMLPAQDARQEICRRFGVAPGRYVIATIHRPENADDHRQLSAILADLRSLNAPVILALHPRTRARTEPEMLSGIQVVAPLTPSVFLSLLAESALAVTDSGGVQEEVTVLGRPALVVRRSTERPESVGRWCDLVQPGAELRARAAERLADVDAWRIRCAWPSPYGDGEASRRISEAICAHVRANESESVRGQSTACLAEAPGSVGVTGRARRQLDRPRRMLRSTVTAATSIVAVMAAGAYLVSPTRLAWAVSTTRTASTNVPAGREIIYGSATGNSSKPIAGVTLSLERQRGRTLIRVLSLTSGATGTFRAQVSLPAATYELVVRGRAGGKTVTTVVHIAIKPGHAYRIKVDLVGAGVVAVVPVRTY
jgi:UDP-N-acetylglucosamine 2-epimerase (non-hydrolysing)